MRDAVNVVDVAVMGSDGGKIEGQVFLLARPFRRLPRRHSRLSVSWEHPTSVQMRAKHFNVRGI